MKTIIITGVDGNLGTAVTRSFLEAGYSVIGTVINDIAKNKVEANANLEVKIVNLADEADTEIFIKTSIEKYKVIDAALLLVGGFAMGSISETSGADLKKMYTLNFETAYYCARPLLAHMKQNGSGRIVFVGARPALQPADGQMMLGYALSKSLLFKLAECINEDVKGKNITATVVVPSTLNTELNRKSMPDKDPADWVKPEEVADIMKFICSDEGHVLRESIFKVYNNS